MSNINENNDIQNSAANTKDLKKKKSTLRVVWEYSRIIIIILAAGFLVNSFVFVNARIPSSSMENTIMAGDRIYGNRLAYITGDPQRYDIVIFKYPDDETQLYIKRVIGLPGETVIISQGKVYAVDAATKTTDIPDESLIADPMQLPFTEVLDDSYIKEPMVTGDAYNFVFRVPEDSYFMLGDNRNHSKDSRYWDQKFVKKDKIVGKAFFRYWPFNKMGIIH